VTVSVLLSVDVNKSVTINADVNMDMNSKQVFHVRLESQNKTLFLLSTSRLQCHGFANSVQHMPSHTE